MKQFLIFLQSIAGMCGLVVGVWTGCICTTIAGATMWLSTIYQAKNYD